MCLCSAVRLQSDFNVQGRRSVWQWFRGIRWFLVHAPVAVPLCFLKRPYCLKLLYPQQITCPHIFVKTWRAWMLAHWGSVRVCFFLPPVKLRICGLRQIAVSWAIRKRISVTCVVLSCPSWTLFHPVFVLSFLFSIVFPCSVFLGAFAELRKATLSFMSVCPRGTTRFPLDGFWWNLIYETFSKIRRENSNFIKIRQK